MTLFKKCSQNFVNKHGISEWGLLALYRHKEILVNSSLKATKKKKKWARVISKVQVSDPGPFWHSCYNLKLLYANSPSNKKKKKNGLG